MNRMTTFALIFTTAAGNAIVVAGQAGWLTGLTPLAEIGRVLGLAAPDAGKDTKKADAKARPASPVVVEPATARDVPQVVEAVGTVQPIISVAIRARLDSQIETVHVAEGARVRTGDPLFTLDGRALRAQLAQVEAQLLKDKAQLEQAERDVTRYEELVARNATTRVNLDNAITNTKVVAAQVAANEANRTNIETQLSFTEIRAPADGRIGSIQAKAGTIVRQGEVQALTTVNQIDPIYVQFALPQIHLADLRRAMTRAAVTVNVDAGGTRLPGEVAFIENTVDVTTGTIAVKARIANPGEVLWPGAFVKAQVTLGVDSQAVVVPSAAIQLGLKGPYLFVIEDGKAELRVVSVRRTTGAETVIAAGVKSGEPVVVEGHLRLVDGAPVTTRPARPAAPVQPARS